MSWCLFAVLCAVSFVIDLFCLFFVTHFIGVFVCACVFVWVVVCFRLSLFVLWGVCCWLFIVCVCFWCRVFFVCCSTLVCVFVCLCWLCIVCVFECVVCFVCFFFVCALFICYPHVFCFVRSGWFLLICIVMLPRVVLSSCLCVRVFLFNVTQLLYVLLCCCYVVCLLFYSCAFIWCVSFAVFMCMCCCCLCACALLLPTCLFGGDCCWLCLSLVSLVLKCMTCCVVLFVVSLLYYSCVCVCVSCLFPYVFVFLFGGCLCVTHLFVLFGLDASCWIDVFWIVFVCCCLCFVFVCVSLCGFCCLPFVLILVWFEYKDLHGVGSLASCKTMPTMVETCAAVFLFLCRVVCLFVLFVCRFTRLFNVVCHLFLLKMPMLVNALKIDSST